MIELCPIPLWYRLDLKSKRLLRDYQETYYGLKLELPQYGIPEDLRELTFIMKQKPHRQVKVK